MKFSLALVVTLFGVVVSTVHAQDSVNPRLDELPQPWVKSSQRIPPREYEATL